MSSIGAQAVALEVAAQSDSPILSNLLELYSHDLSDVFALKLGADGRFGYDKLPLYWSEPRQRLPGHWVVRVSEGNPGACRFSEHAISEFTGGTFERAARPGNLHAWRVLSFDSGAASQ